MLIMQNYRASIADTDTNTSTFLKAPSMSERADIFEHGSEITPACAALPLSDGRRLHHSSADVLSHVTAWQQIKAGKEARAM